MKSKTILIAGIVVAGVVASLVIQRHGQSKLSENDVLLRQQGNELSELLAERERLTTLVGRSNTSTPQDQAMELTKLRAKAEALRRQTNELGKQLERMYQLRPAPPPSEPSQPPEYYQRLHQVAG